MMTLLLFLIIGLIAGAIARLLVPGRDPMGLLGTLLLGVVGAFIGGTLWNLITVGSFEFQASGLIGAIIGGIIALLIYRMIAARA